MLNNKEVMRYLIGVTPGNKMGNRLKCIGKIHIVTPMLPWQGNSFSLENKGQEGVVTAVTPLFRGYSHQYIFCFEEKVVFRNRSDFNIKKIVEKVANKDSRTNNLVVKNNLINASPEVLALLDGIAEIIAEEILVNLNDAESTMNYKGMKEDGTQ